MTDMSDDDVKMTIELRDTLKKSLLQLYVQNNMSSDIGFKEFIFPMILEQIRKIKACDRMIHTKKFEKIY